MRLPTLSLLLALGLLLGACDSASDAPEPTFGDPYTVLVTDESPVIRDSREGPRVRVEVEYGGGCEDHEFVLRSRMDSKNAEIWFVHDAKGDPCYGLLQATFERPVPEAVMQAESVTLLTPPSSNALQLSVPARR